MHRNAPIGAKKINIYGRAAIEGHPSPFDLSHINCFNSSSMPGAVYATVRCRVLLYF